jgi:protein gp37
MPTKIEWTDETWSPVTGCTKVSAGCKNCYAERGAKRFAGRFGYPENNPFAVTLHPNRLDQPLRWRKPRKVFVCSMGDLFHRDVPDEYIAAVFGVMAASPSHTFQLLTKRPERMCEWFQWIENKIRVGATPASAESNPVFACGKFAAEEFSKKRNRVAAANVLFLGHVFGFDPHDYWPLPNVWLGTSAEDQATLDERVPYLLRCPAAVLFVSLEPLLGPVDLMRLSIEIPGTIAPDDGWKDVAIGKHLARNLDWVIVGGETGPGARPMDPDWARSIRDQCRAAGVAFFMKQMAGKAPVPDDLLVREFPGELEGRRCGC